MNLQRILEMCKTSQTLVKECYSLTEDLQDERRDVKVVPIAEFVDAAYLLKQASEMLDDCRKMLAKSSEGFQTIAAGVQIQHDLGATVRTNRVTATPDIQTSANAPSATKEPERFQQWCEFFGIPMEQAHLVRFHYPSIAEKLSEMQKLGKQIPDFVTKEYTNLRLKFRKKNDYDMEKELKDVSQIIS